MERWIEHVKNGNEHVGNPTMPVTRASIAHQVGIHRTSTGQQVPIRRAMIAQKSGLILGNTDKSLL